MVLPILSCAALADQLLDRGHAACNLLFSVCVRPGSRTRRLDVALLWLVAGPGSGPLLAPPVPAVGRVAPLRGAARGYAAGLPVSPRRRHDPPTGAAVELLRAGTRQDPDRPGHRYNITDSPRSQNQPRGVAEGCGAGHGVFACEAVPLTSQRRSARARTMAPMSRHARPYGPSHAAADRRSTRLEAEPAGIARRSPLTGGCQLLASRRRRLAPGLQSDDRAGQCGDGRDALLQRRRPRLGHAEPPRRSGRRRSLGCRSCTRLADARHENQAGSTPPWPSCRISPAWDGPAALDAASRSPPDGAYGRRGRLPSRCCLARVADRRPVSCASRRCGLSRDLSAHFAPDRVDPCGRCRGRDVETATRSPTPDGHGQQTRPLPRDAACDASLQI